MYPCPQCSASFIKPRGLFIHTVMMHKGIVYKLRHNKLQPFTCFHCSRRYLTKTNLNKHLLNVHSDETVISNLTYPCRFCQKAFAQRRYRNRHENRYHSDMPKLCDDCNIPLTEENSDRWARENGRHICTECARQRHKLWRDANIIHIRKNAKDINKRSRLKIRAEAIAAYGGQCECCGISDFELLTIDHILHDGSTERKLRRRGGHTFYYDLKKLGWPKDRYRLLCWNCNMSRSIWGYCPHQRQLELFPSFRNGKAWYVVQASLSQCELSEDRPARLRTDWRGA